MKKVFLALVIFAALATAAWADLIYLKNGRVVSGRIVEEDDEKIVVEVPYGQLTIPRRDIDRIEREKPLEYRQRQGRELLARRHPEAALAEFQKALEADPANAEARRGAADALFAMGETARAEGRFNDAEDAFRRAGTWAGADAANEGLKRCADRRREIETLLVGSRESLNAGRPADVTEPLAALIRESPDYASQARTLLAQAFASLGQSALRDRRFPDAARFIADAIELHPEFAAPLRNAYLAAHLNAAGELLKANRATDAARYITEAAGFAPDDPRIAFYLGGMLERSGKSAEAARSYAWGLRAIDPAAQTAGRTPAQLRAALMAMAFPTEAEQIRRLERLQEIDWSSIEQGEWGVIESEHFRVRHRNAAVGERVRQAAEAWFRRIQEFYEIGEADWGKEKADIFIYPRKEEYLAAFSAPAWTGGMAQILPRSSGAVKRRFGTWQTAPRLLDDILPHELTHLVVGVSLGYKAASFPLALQEGMAVIMEPGVHQRYYDRVLAEGIRARRQIPLGLLLKMKDMPEDRQDLFYAQSMDLVRTLIARAGMSKFKAFVASVDIDGVEAALRNHYGMDPG